MGSLRKEEEGASTLHKKNKKQKKNDEMMSSLGWNIMFTDNLKVLVWYFWAKNLMEIWYLLITEKFLFWSFRQWEIGSFFQPKSWWKDDVWSFWAFHIPGLGKYGFSRSALQAENAGNTDLCIFFSQDTPDAFVGLSKSTAIGVEFQKFTKYENAARKIDLKLFYWYPNHPLNLS